MFIHMYLSICYAIYRFWNEIHIDNTLMGHRYKKYTMVELEYTIY